jgi:hypothetical protein
MAGVMTKAGAFLPAFVKSTDTTGRTLQIPVPPNESVQLMISGFQVALTDPTGAIVPAGGGRITVVPSLSSITFTVSGLVPLGR